MSPIVYGILSPSGLVMKKGEPVEIKNAIGMTFGIHCNDRRTADDELRFVVTNIETGMLAGNGTTRDAAIERARMRVQSAIKRGTLARTFEESMRTRAAILVELGDVRAEGAA
ncbi:TPA: hypothetical protein QDA94_002778 [Burkholderia vietnamiensis]|nr:hypothetical protein [Burkholderia vietnamiensis]HDR9200994.1 hypothetical protein [Burkholderia vietnamiensis]HDR9231810.1 hypothetical protein [Burkholderia vietnamiensis]